MAEKERRAIGILNSLYRLCRAGEWGYEVVAENVSNRGLKVVLKSYAQRRNKFANELKEEIQRLGGEASERKSIRGVIHRGRINIRAALTIGAQSVENVVLTEALHGENAAVKAYKNALSKGLPAETQAIVQRQYEAIEAAREQVELLRGRAGERLVVRLFDSDRDADTAVQALTNAGFDPSHIEVVDVKQVTDVYYGKGSAVSEAVISGAFGGSIWGSIIAAAAGLGAALIPGIGVASGSEAQTWAVVTLTGTIIGALFGMILGFLIGQGITEEDTYLYDDSVKHGTKLSRLHTTDARASEAAQIMHQVNASARAHAREWELAALREAEKV
ncbi:MAG: PA2169 family four-helix-bundle protein [Chloroflexi bacterium]|nr:PA2169 family four-helix-bundle protein [Chloroflexota bacterium]MCI0580679.1 PA2169 family four-helix-bundle protein [Chloroflexota bacterium]MCI0648590.1 PA2169 family four-helix-bundle protein [Chloroflexota bacterium]MCI0727353.1 PA2169 family four-helix-bundle protein [Chloroflexota bacterium]